MHTRVDQCFHKVKDIGWARARERRGHIKVVLVIHKHGLAKRAKQRFRLAALRGGHSRQRRPHGDALANLRRRVGHGAHHRCVPQARSNAGQAGARNDRHH